MRDRGSSIRAVIMDRLGPNVWHQSTAEASALLVELEETARPYLFTRPEPLLDSQITKLRTHFDAGR
jgi:3-dehydro-4-phosphotetronate decarboxylase